MSAVSELELEGADGGPLPGTWLAPRGWRRFVRDRYAMAGALIVLALLLTAFVLPLILADPDAIDPSAPLAAPSTAHLLGTDPFGRDLLSRTAAGLRTSLTIAMLAVAGAAVVGIVLGMLAGFLRGVADAVIMRVIDAVLAFPVLLLALFVVAALGPGTTHLALSIGFVFVPYFARLMRTQTMALRTSEFVVASEAYGTSPLRLLTTVIFPNTLTPILVQLSLSMGFAILAEAGLSFLGLGVQPPSAALGLMLQDAQTYLQQSLWYSVVPGVAIIIAVLGFNLLGDGIRDAFDSTGSDR
jgi:ABC-type dipeptide/oligopeptide/nickel transport system permease subunit